MPAVDYQAGGLYWAEVQNVMNACACTRLRAVSALKSCANDPTAAIESLQEVAALSAPAKKPTLSSLPAPNASLQEGVTPRSTPFSTPPPVYTAEPTYRKVQHGERPSVAAHFVANEAASAVQGLSLTDRRPAPRAPGSAVGPDGEWDFGLPEVRLGRAEDEFVVDEGRSRPFSLQRLLSVLQHGMPPAHLQHYLSFFSAAAVRTRINDAVCGYPAIFYVVATNDERLVRIWVDHGGDVNAVEPGRGIPLLAFAVLLGSVAGIDSTKTVTTLLSLEADVACIPRVFYSPYLSDPVDRLPFGSQVAEFREARKAWCVEWIRPVFARTVNLTQRYFLQKTAKGKVLTERQKQVARLHRATALLGVSYFLIGQTSAARTVTQKLLSHMALPRSKPLVLVFAGPSGHGKTELARRMGELLTLEMECIDCTEMKHETDLFGPKKPYLGYETGSPLNNFLARMSGRRSIVFLDEFEKTTKEVQNSLLIPFDEGKYMDRRTREVIDCMQTIWIMATNAVDSIILDFCEVHGDAILLDDDPIQQSQMANELAAKMRTQLKTEFGNPLTGRVTATIPFLPFTPGEAAVVAHKYVLALAARVAGAVNSSGGGGGQLVGRVALAVERSGALCTLLAAEGYDADTGARSLEIAVAARVEEPLVQAYLEEDGEIHDLQPRQRYVVDVAQGGSDVVSVFRAGDE